MRGAYCERMRRAVLAAMLIGALALPGTAGAKAWHGPVQLTCGPGPPFAPSAFANPTGAEAADTPQAQALRDQLRAERDTGFPSQPQTGWRILAETADVVLFHHGRPDSGVAYTFTLVDGRWRVSSFGCTPRRFVRDFEVARVELRPGYDRRSRSLKVYALTGHCSAVAPARRFRLVHTEERRHTLTLLALLKPEKIQPFVACPSVGVNVPATVYLERPLGRRAVRDASVYPPRMLGRAAR
jgi:hypothetical protein